MTTPREDPVALLTGAGGGLGRVITDALLTAGFRVAAIDLESARLENAFSDGIARGRVLPISCNITDEEAVAAAVARVDVHFGRLDVLVNNAGVEPHHSIRDLDMAIWDATFAVNVRAPMMLVKHCVPIWERQGAGRVIFIGSRTWLSGSSTSSYVSSKAAVVGLMRSVASEMGPAGITSNVVAPSFVRTPLNAEKGDQAYVDDYAERFRGITPLRHLIEPQDVAGAVIFLASPAARNITGTILDVTAGSHLAPTVR